MQLRLGGAVADDDGNKMAREGSHAQLNIRIPNPHLSSPSIAFIVAVLESVYCRGITSWGSRELQTPPAFQYRLKNASFSVYFNQYFRGVRRAIDVTHSFQYIFKNPP